MPVKTIWTDTLHCKSLAHCKACRLDPAFRDNIRENFIAGHGKFPCPHKLRRLWYIGRRAPVYRAGDVMYGIFTMLGISRAVQWLDDLTGHECGCQRRRQEINRHGLLRWIYLSLTGKLNHER